MPLTGVQRHHRADDDDRGWADLGSSDVCGHLGQSGSHGALGMQGAVGNHRDRRVRRPAVSDQHVGEGADPLDGHQQHQGAA